MIQTLEINYAFSYGLEFELLKTDNQITFAKACYVYTHSKLKVLLPYDKETFLHVSCM